jgi:hypothetical protein
MSYSPGIVLGHFFSRNRHHYLPCGRPRHTPKHNTAYYRSTSWKDSGHTHHFPFPFRHRTCRLRGIDPLVVLSHPWSVFHVRAQCSPGTPACHDWTIHGHPPPVLHGDYRTVHWRPDLVWIADFVAPRLRDFGDHPRTENICTGMAGGKRRRYGKPPA